MSEQEAVRKEERIFNSKLIDVMKIKGKATKKPVEIEFWRNTGKEENALKMMDWIGEGNTVEFSCPEHEDCWDGTLIISTLEGDMRVDVGDYVIRGVNGEHYPCKPDIFHKTYNIED